MHEILEIAEQVGSVSFDVEHNPDMRPFDKGFSLHGCSFATGDRDNPQTWYLTNIDEYLPLCRELFAKQIDCIAHNGKYDILCLRAIGLLPKEYPIRFCDTMVACNLLWDNLTPRNLGLKPTILRMFQHKMMDFATASEHGLNSEVFADYAKEDAFWEYRLWHKVADQLDAAQLDHICRKIICPASLAFSDMEYSGMRWDVDFALKLYDNVRDIRDRLRVEILTELGDINPDSPRQLEKIFFDEWGADRTRFKTTPTGKIKVDDRALQQLATKFPIAETILTYRKAQKQLGTYIIPLTQKALSDQRSRIHPTFWLVSSTGRTRSERPNFQNVSRSIKLGNFKGNLRQCFAAEDGWSFVIADQSQIELRLVAHFSQDKELLRAYREWGCGNCGHKGSEKEIILHSCPQCGAAENEKFITDPSVPAFWHGLDLHSLTANNLKALAGDRQRGKTCNFALVYGATAYTMNLHNPSASQAEWERIIEQFMQFYEGVKKWHRKCEVIMHKQGSCRDPFNRRRSIPKLERASKHALNQIVNFGPQSGACNLMLLCVTMLRDKWIASDDWETNVRFVNFVHDEVVAECRDDCVDRISQDIQHVMETAVRFRVPLRADVKVSKHCGVK